MIFVGIVVLTLALVLSGCTDNGKDDGTDSQPETVTMNAQEFGEDMKFEMLETSMKTYFVSLDDGDILIFQDEIAEISYDETTDITTIEFEYSQGEGEGTYTSTTQFIFDGDLTGEYSIGDEVKITVTIKHVTVTIQGMTLDMEIYEEYWVSEQYFTENYMTGNPYQALSAEKITKV
ncbi:MAG TPA: hypothetical protein ENN45_00650 [Bacteroidetes bacterium]|nr:hypothetical protein [Bacteroidota bacterium]